MSPAAAAVVQFPYEMHNPSNLTSSVQVMQWVAMDLFIYLLLKKWGNQSTEHTEGTWVRTKKADDAVIEQGLLSYSHLLVFFFLNHNIHSFSPQHCWAYADQKWTLWHLVKTHTHGDKRDHFHWSTFYTKVFLPKNTTDDCLITQSRRQDGMIGWQRLNYLNFEDSSLGHIQQ